MGKGKFAKKILGGMVRFSHILFGPVLYVKAIKAQENVENKLATGSKQIQLKEKVNKKVEIKNQKRQKKEKKYLCNKCGKKFLEEKLLLDFDFSKLRHNSEKDIQKVCRKCHKKLENLSNQLIPNKKGFALGFSFGGIAATFIVIIQFFIEALRSFDPYYAIMIFAGLSFGYLLFSFIYCKSIKHWCSKIVFRLFPFKVFGKNIRRVEGEINIFLDTFLFPFIFPFWIIAVLISMLFCSFTFLFISRKMYLFHHKKVDLI